jgi:hypothetical protein
MFDLKTFFFSLYIGNDPFYSVFSELSSSAPRVQSLLGFTTGSSSSQYSATAEFFGPSDTITAVTQH